MSGPIPGSRDPRRALRGAARRRASRAAAARLDALLIGVGADLRYLTGYDAVPLERLTMLVVPVADGAQLYADRPAARDDAGARLRRRGVGRGDGRGAGRRPRTR